MSITKLTDGLIEAGTIQYADLNVSVSGNISSSFARANTANTTATSASSYANSAYVQANTATTNAATADQRAVTSGSYANAAYGQANTTTTNATSASSYANSAYGQANTATTNASTADQRAVTSGSYANSAYNQANTSLSTSGGTVTGATTFRATNAIRSEASSAQDAIVIAGRAGGTSSYSANITPATLSATRTVTVPDETFTMGFRNIPAVGTKTSSYSLTTSDIGKYVQVGAGGSITIPDNVFAEGDVVGIFNNTSGSITITCTITTAYIAGADADKATMSLASRGIASILFISPTICVVMGNVS